jgi:hypothetical protein
MCAMTLYNEICDPSDNLPSVKLPSNNQYKLPRGTYVFVDLYCPALNCNCKNGIVDIYKIGKNSDVYNQKITLKNRPQVTLKFSWKKNPNSWKIEVYSSHQSFDKTQKFLALFNQLVKDSFAEKLTSRYSRFKQTIKENARRLDAMIEHNMETSEKIGRNDMCPCGSGKKYKKCCINLDNI